VAALAVTLPCFAAPPTAAVPDAQTYQQTVDRAIQFLRSKQAPDGSFARTSGPGVTAVTTTGLMRVGLTPNDPMVAKALKYLESFQQKDGGIYNPRDGVPNYETSLAIVCFQEANSDHRYDKLVKQAEKFLKGIQWGGENQPADQSNPAYGGAGYGKHKRPDLSNTQFFLDALKAAGDGPDDPAVQRAMIFVYRCQNLESEYNTTPFPAKNPDGGFYYTPAAGGDSEAGKLPNGGLRSYASMTYAGLKSMIYAGVKADDPRVKAAVKWCQMHYGLEDNPGIGKAGLYYYYQTFAKALDASGLKSIKDEKGVEHDWRQDLLAALQARQRPNGSWVNDDKHWFENEPCLVTGYALLSLSYCRPAAEK
jgi:squalene-hopene/tetraprenyl-beta-curcumene cyclase